jgi:iron complex transport system substrate-binding protein
LPVKEKQKFRPQIGQISQIAPNTRKDGNLELKSGNFTYNFKQNQTPFKKIILLNASMAGIFQSLEQKI